MKKQDTRYPCGSINNERCSKKRNKNDLFNSSSHYFYRNQFLSTCNQKRKVYIVWVNNKDQGLKAVIYKSLLLSLLKEFGTLEKWFDSIGEGYQGNIKTTEINDDWCTRVKYRDC